ncbi:MAG: hypothetical protein K1W13_04760 [Lachnospiraceae bacterium]
MFETWLRQEKETIKERFGKSRILCIFLALLMVPLALLNLIMLLDGGGAMQLGAFFFMIVVMLLILFLGNYKRRLVKPLMASVKKELSSEEERQEFARQMSAAVCITYQPLPQIKECEIMASPLYCYMRQPGKSRIFRTGSIRRAVLTKEPADMRTFRRFYTLSLYTADKEKTPVWRGWFESAEELYQAYAHFKLFLPPQTLIEDNAADKGGK